MAVSAAVTSPTATTPTAAAATANSGASIAQNFSQFLQLLTTQLKNQNPLEPLDTNQFTQQLVQFAQVEQQINTNSSLSTLVSLQQASQTSAAMSFLGTTVRVEGSTTALKGGAANWAYSVDKAAVGTINVKNANGELVYTENRTLTAGPQNFAWNGRNNAGLTQPDGNYTISIVAKDASGQSVAVSTDVDGVVDGVDLSKTPPVLSVGGQSFTLDKVKQVRRAAS
jgi:flagellar basal-body rod modification protein FlgD